MLREYRCDGVSWWFRNCIAMMTLSKCQHDGILKTDNEYIIINELTLSKLLTQKVNLYTKEVHNKRMMCTWIEEIHAAFSSSDSACKRCVLSIQTNLYVIGKVVSSYHIKNNNILAQNGRKEISSFLKK